MHLIKFRGNYRYMFIVQWLVYVLCLSLRISGIISSYGYFAIVAILEFLLFYLGCKSIKNSKSELDRFIRGKLISILLVAVCALVSCDLIGFFVFSIMLPSICVASILLLAFEYIKSRQSES